jgi:exosortase
VGAGAIRALFGHALSDDSASHVVLVPFVSLGLIWARRRIVFAAARSFPSGIAVAAAAGAVAAAWAFGLLPGTRGLSLVWPVASLATAWIGGFLVFFGPEAFKAARFPLLFLLLAIPMPDAALGAATAVLKSGSTEAVDVLFALSGTPYYRSAFVFELPTVAIEIADECSGIRSSIALGVMALLAGHLYLDSAWQKAVLLLAVLPLAILKNAVRIVTLSLLAEHLDPSFLDGQLHHEGGIVFFAMSLALLVSLIPVLRRFDGRLTGLPRVLPRVSVERP